MSPGNSGTNRGWIAAALAGAVLCLAFGLLLGRRASRPPSGEAPPEIEDIDPATVVCREAGRLATGLERLRGVAAGPDDRLYVVGDEALVVLGSGGEAVSRVALEEPALCVAAGPDSAIYLGMRNHVEVFDAGGSKKAAWERLGPRAWITSVAVSEDSVFAADFGNRIVLRYDKEGKLLGRIGAKDEAKEIPGLMIPSPFFDVAVGPSGTLWVANTGRHSLEGYRKDGSPVSSWGASSWKIEGFSGCCNPSHFAIRRDGSFVTAEKGLVRIKIHGPGGGFVGVVAGPADFPAGTVGLDVAVDSKGRILVADPSTSAIRVYVGKSAGPGD